MQLRQFNIFEITGRYEWGTAEDKSSAKLRPTFHEGYFVLFKYNM